MIILGTLAATCKLKEDNVVMIFVTALVTNEESAHLTRMHNNSNIICMGAKFTSYDEAIKYLDAFLNEQFEGGRHQRRVDQIEG